MAQRPVDPRRIAVTAVMSAIVFALTYVRLFPTPDGGYIHLGDAGIFFASLAFGPLVGAVAGGLGTALADLAGGYGQWAPFSFVIHGLQGLAAGWLASRFPPIPWLIAAAIAGGLVVVAGYLPVGMVLTSVPQAVAALPWNVVQVTIGAAVGLPLYLAVRRAYPRIAR